MIKPAASIFSSCTSTEEGTISLLNVCVDKKDRSQSIGAQKLSSFIQAYPESKMDLFVLDENETAVRMYRRFGFVQTDMINGFSSNTDPLPCLVMVKTHAGT